MLPAAVLALAVSAAPPPGEPERLDLRAVLARAEDQYPEMAIVGAERRAAQALVDQAHWARWTPKVTDTTAFGIVPGARGTVLDSPDSNRDLNDFGLFFRTRVDLQMPVYTFGRLSGTQDAARTFLASRDARGRSRRNAARLLAARAYFGYLQAEESLKLVADIRKHLDRLIAELEDPRTGEEEDGADADPIDLYKARNYGFQLDRQEAEATRGLAIASRGLLELAATAPDAPVRPRAAGLTALGAAVPDLAAGLREALDANPDLQEARLAARARDRFAGVAARENLPVLGIEGRFEYGHASGRETQDNPFVYEPFNVRTLSAAFGLRWELNFLQTGARIRKERADALELRARADALEARLRVDVAEKHARLASAVRIHESGRRALSTTANWLRVAEENHGLGSAPVKDVIDAYAAWVQSRAGALASIHDLNLALIEWRLLLGRAPLEEGEAP